MVIYCFYCYNDDYDVEESYYFDDYDLALKGRSLFNLDSPYLGEIRSINVEDRYGYLRKAVEITRKRLNI